MTGLSMYAASVPLFLQTLDALSAILDKAENHAQSRKIEPRVILDYRLQPDMFPFVRQVQLSTDFAKGAAARLAGVDVPVYEDVEHSFAELKARLQRTSEFLKRFSREQIEGTELKDINIKIAGNPVTLKGQPYLVHFALPNFFFHATTAYAILRHAGVPLGKLDFMGRVPGLTLS